MYHNLKAFQVKFKLKLVKGKKTPYLDNDVIMNSQKGHLNPRIELGNSDFPDQRILVSKNSCVAKNQTQMPVGVTFWFPVYPTIKQLRRKRQWKHHLRSFSLHRVYLASLGFLNFWSWILQDGFQEEKEEFVVVCSRPSLWSFTS